MVDKAGSGFFCLRRIVSRTVELFASSSDIMVMLAVKSPVNAAGPRVFFSLSPIVVQLPETYIGIL
jgi:hypothetical protein